MTFSKIAASVLILGSVAFGISSANAFNANTVINGSTCDFGAFGQTSIIGQNSALSHTNGVPASSAAHAYYPHDQKWAEEGPLQAPHQKGAVFNRSGLRFAGIAMALCASVE